MAYDLRSKEKYIALKNYIPTIIQPILAG